MENILIGAAVIGLVIGLYFLLKKNPTSTGVSGSPAGSDGGNTKNSV